MQAAKTSHVRNVAVPPVMYGTAWKEDRTQALVLEAIATGFRAFDTANQRKHYVEGEVGAAVRAAIASGTVTQEDLFLQTEFTYQRGQDYRLPYDPGRLSFSSWNRQATARHDGSARGPVLCRSRRPDLSRRTPAPRRGRASRPARPRIPSRFQHVSATGFRLT